MLTLKVYNGEYFERDKRWYLIFLMVMLLILGLTLFYKSGGTQGIIGGVILMLIVGAYLFFLNDTHKQVELKITPQAIMVNTKMIPFASLKGFVVEMEKKTGEIKNIVFVGERALDIYTINDTQDNQQLFFSALAEYIPLLEEYDQSLLERIMRKLKL